MHTLRCQTCSTTVAFDADPKDVEAWFPLARAAGWMDQAKKGAGKAKWPWWCQACAPHEGPDKLVVKTGWCFPTKKD